MLPILKHSTTIDYDLLRRKTAMLTIVSLMKEAHEDIAHFIEYHAGLGIDDILVFYDADDVQILREYLQEKLNDCDYSIFALSECPELQQHLRPPKLFEPIQNAVHQLAQKKARYPWLITLDADEFLFANGLKLIGTAEIPDYVTSLRFPVAEAVWLAGDDLTQPFGSSGFRIPFNFRRPKRLASTFRKILPRAVYREDSFFFPDNVSGHGQGRHIFGSDTEFDYIGPHHAEVDGNDVSLLATKLPLNSNNTIILHYDAISFESWRIKIRRRVEGEIASHGMRPERRKLLEAFVACKSGTKDETERIQKHLFLRLYSLNRRQFHLLRAFRSAFHARPCVSS
jgi:hypothetical protein